MRALITGITGQDGSYLAELLLEKGYEIFGLVRRDDPERYDYIRPIASRIRFIEGDLTDQGSLNAALRLSQPHELYNAAAQSFAAGSWRQPLETADVTGVGVLRVLEAIRTHSPKTKLVQASSSEMFSRTDGIPVTEKTPFHPRSPYGVAKAFAHNLAVNYRESFGIFACSCICFNHESPRRGSEFLTRKVTQHAAAIKMGTKDKLTLGNLDARRDWGFAGDFVRAMWLMLQQPAADDYVIATGEVHGVRDVLDVAFSYVGLNWRNYVEIDSTLVRGPQDCTLFGDASKARKMLGWKPEVNFQRLIEMMVESDLDTLRRELAGRSAAAGA